MKKLIFLVTLLTLCVALLGVFAGCDDPIEIPDINKIEGALLVNKTEPLVNWQGRYEYKTANGDLPDIVMLYNTATGFVVEFYGTELKVDFYHQATATGGSNIYYNVAVDDEVIPTTAPQRTICLPDAQIRQMVTLVSGLEKGKHTVTCLKMSEPADAVTGIVSLQTDGGFYPRNVEVDKAKLKFMFVCASGGSGYGSLVSTTGKNSISRSRANSSSLHAFNYLTARIFDADVQFVAQAGWGVSFPTKRAISKVFDHTGILGYGASDSYKNSVAGAQTTALWDHSQWVPDVVIFNIGGNDTMQSSFNKDTYQRDVVALVKKIHELYPNAVMLWTRTQGSKCGTYALSALSTEGIMRAGYLVETVIPQVGDDGTYGASSHNSLQTHVATADILAQALQQHFGLQPFRDNVTMQYFASVVITS